MGKILLQLTINNYENVSYSNWIPTTPLRTLSSWPSGSVKRTRKVLSTVVLSLWTWIHQILFLRLFVPNWPSYLLIVESAPLLPSCACLTQAIHKLFNSPLFILGVLSTPVGCGTALQAERSRVRSRLGLWDFSLTVLPAALWSWGRISF
jgi:hypothetical protein